eukprot:1716002-Amphidinium_carterae.1
MNPNGTPLPPLILQPGSPVNSQLIAQNAQNRSTGYEPNITQGPGTPAVQQMLMPPPGTPAVQQMLPPPPPPPPPSGRSGPYNHGPGGPGRIPVTPPAIAGMVPAEQVPVGGDAE